MDKIAAMTAFVKVVEHHGFSRAADALDVSRPSITRQVKALEDELGVALLERTTRRVTLTTQGVTYHARATRFLAALGQLDSGALLHVRQARGVVRVEVPPGLASERLIPAMGRFVQAYPEVNVEWLARHRNADLLAEGIDCSLRVGPVREQHLVARRLGGFGLRTCAAPAYLDHRVAPAHPRDLGASHHLIGLVAAQQTGALPWQFVGDGTRIDIAGPWRLIFSDARAAAEAAMAGGGLAQLPDYLAAPRLAAGTLVEVLRPWRAPATSVHVVYPPNRFLATKVRVFIDWAAEVLASPGVED
jgi:DNA-binding transcriptional LysR family regulator